MTAPGGLGVLSDVTPSHPQTSVAVGVKRHAVIGRGAAIVRNGAIKRVAVTVGSVNESSPTGTCGLASGRRETIASNKLPRAG